MLPFLALIAGLTLVPSILASLAFRNPHRLKMRDLAANWLVAFTMFVIPWMVMIELTGFRGHTNLFIGLAFSVSVFCVVLFNVAVLMVRRKNQAGKETA